MNHAWIEVQSRHLGVLIFPAVHLMFFAAVKLLLLAQSILPSQNQWAAKSRTLDSMSHSTRYFDVWAVSCCVCVCVRVRSAFALHRNADVRILHVMCVGSFKRYSLTISYPDSDWLKWLNHQKVSVKFALCPCKRRCSWEPEAWTLFLRWHQGALSAEW